MHYGVDFRLADPGFKPKARTMAVISGIRKQQSVDIAMLLDLAMHNESKYSVLPPARIKHLARPYPVDIQGPYKSAYFEIDTDWSMTDRQKIARIQRQLGVENLLVIWAPIAVSVNDSPIIQIPVVAQMFEPGGKVVAQSNMMLAVGDKGNKYLVEGVTGIADNIAQKTGMARKKAH